MGPTRPEPRRGGHTRGALTARPEMCGASVQSDLERRAETSRAGGASAPARLRLTCKSPPPSPGLWTDRRTSGPRRLPRSLGFPLRGAEGRRQGQPDGSPGGRWREGKKRRGQRAWIPPWAASTGEVGPRAPGCSGQGPGEGMKLGSAPTVPPWCRDPASESPCSACSRQSPSQTLRSRTLKSSLREGLAAGD